MWNTALIFSNENHDLSGKKAIEKTRLFKSFWITHTWQCHMQSEYIDEIKDVMISIKKINKNFKSLKKIK